MAGNWERSERLPVGRTMPKKRAAARLVTSGRWGPPPRAGGIGPFKTGISLLFEMFSSVWFQMSDVSWAGFL